MGKELSHSSVLCQSQTNLGAELLGETIWSPASEAHLTLHQHCKRGANFSTSVQEAAAVLLVGTWISLAMLMETRAGLFLPR